MPLTKSEHWEHGYHSGSWMIHRVILDHHFKVIFRTDKKMSFLHDEASLDDEENLMKHPLLTDSDKNLKPIAKYTGISLYALGALALIVLTACDPNAPVTPKTQAASISLQQNFSTLMPHSFKLHTSSLTRFKDGGHFIF